MNFLLGWFLEHRSAFSIGVAAILLAISLVLRYGFDVWWPWGMAMSGILGLIGLMSAFGER